MEYELTARGDVVANIKPGYCIIIQLKSKDKHEVIVESIDTNAITGNGTRYLLNDIDEIYISRLNSGKTTAVMIGGTILAAVGMTALMLMALLGAP